MMMFSVLTLIVSIAFAILGIILFFKVWGMCNDVAEICFRLKKAFPTDAEKKAAEWLQKQQEDNVAPESNGGVALKVGDNVIYEPMNRKMIIKSITPEGLLVCISYKQDGKEEYEGTYKPSQVKNL